jgi:hypothetical protein
MLGKILFHHACFFVLGSHKIPSNQAIGPGRVKVHDGNGNVDPTVPFGTEEQAERARRI